MSRKVWRRGWESFGGGEGSITISTKRCWQNDVIIIILNTIV
jgi:hypothetical protein